MAKIYTIKYIIDGRIVYTDKALLTTEDVKTLQADGVVVTVQ